MVVVIGGVLALVMGPKWADTKVTSNMSKMGGGMGVQSHFWTVSKSKALFSDVFPRSENCISHLLKGLLPHGQSVNDLVCCLLVLVLVPGCQGLVQGSQDDDQGRGSWIMIRDGEESDL